MITIKRSLKPMYSKLSPTHAACQTFSDIKEVLLFDQKVTGRSPPRSFCKVFVRSSFLCKNFSLAASSFSGFGPEDGGL